MDSLLGFWLLAGRCPRFLHGRQGRGIVVAITVTPLEFFYLPFSSIGSNVGKALIALQFVGIGVNRYGMLAMDPLLTEKELASLLRVSLWTVQEYRRKGIGPPFIRPLGLLKGQVKYRQEDVEAWLQGRRVDASGGS